MAKARVEIDGLELDPDEYLDYINTEVYELDHTPEHLRELNRKFGFPTKDGAQL